MRYRKVAAFALSLFALAVVSFFYVAELRDNWAAIGTYHLRLAPLPAAMSVVAVLATCLLSTYAWCLTVNGLSAAGRMSFAGGVAVVNTSNLSKYVPGKVWSYALQTWWLSRSGFSPSLVAYVFLVNTFISLMAFMLLGAGCLLLSPGEFPPSAVLLLLLGLIVIDLLFIALSAHVFKFFVDLVNRAFRRELDHFRTPPRLLLQLHAVYLLAAFCFGAGAYFTCLGIGLDVGAGEVLPVMSSMMISDVLGFLAVIVPGGLGVREGVMFFLLGRTSSETVSLILPLATRIVIMLVDLSLGTIGFLLLRKYSTVERAPDRSGA